MRTLPLIAALAALSLAGQAMAQTVALKGPDGQSASLSPADLAALPQVKLTVTHHGKTETFEGAPLADVVARVGAASGKAVRGPELATVIRVTARCCASCRRCMSSKAIGLRCSVCCPSCVKTRH